MNKYQEELKSRIQSAGLSEVSAYAILENSGVLEAMERHGSAIPSMEEFKAVELEAITNATPITLAINELIDGYKQAFNATSNVRQEEILSRIADKLAPEVDPLAEQLKHLSQTYENELQHGSVETATDLYNQIQDLRANGMVQESPETMPKMSAKEVTARGISFVTEYLHEYPEQANEIIGYMEP